MTSILMVQVAWFAAVSLRRAANNRHHVHSDRDRAQTGDRLGKNSSGTRLSWRSRFDGIVFMPKPATTRDRLGKTPGTNANHGHHAFLNRDLAKNRNNPPPLGKILEKPPIMATTLFSDRPRAKTGDLRPAWGNSQRNPFIMAIAKKNPVRLAKLFGLAKPSGLAKPRELRPTPNSKFRTTFVPS